MLTATKLQMYQGIYPEQTNAHNAVSRALAHGDLAPVSTRQCADCGNPAQQYHHESYEPERWLDVTPLCRKCHMKRRGKVGKSNAPRGYTTTERVAHWLRMDEAKVVAAIESGFHRELVKRDGNRWIVEHYWVYHFCEYPEAPEIRQSDAPAAS